ncbi:MAG: TIGR02452 family protein [Lachnospiraceae bacterium]|nr:TIGR02452 family protein [Lachnospiraceae bacterium]
MSREDNVVVFQDTERLVKSNKALAEAVKHSTAAQKLVLESDEVAAAGELQAALEQYAEEAKVVVSGKRSYEAAAAYRGRKTCVHNFASASNPGGGVVKGSSAQEECLCRCSTLYFSLNTPAMWDGFYTPHRAAQDPIHNDDCIYTPDVVVMKTDTAAPKLMAEKDWYQVNVVTCAAPNLRQKPSNAMNAGDGNKQVKLQETELLALHEKRLARILDVALAGGNEVVILGAFGCGAFENDPRIVAKAAANTVPKYRHAFKVIEFAVYCSPRDEKNYLIFKRELKKLD